MASALPRSAGLGLGRISFLEQAWRRKKGPSVTDLFDLAISVLYLDDD